MGSCILCHKSSPLISRAIGVCLTCIRQGFSEVKLHLEEVHARSRRQFDLPEMPPKDPGGIKCGLCANKCSMGEGQYGYCGVRKNEEGKLVGANAEKGNVRWYYDALSTNCVAEWVCPGCTGSGYPKYAYKDGPEIGYKNLAVFYRSCSFDCLFCQNWHYRQEAKSQSFMTAQELADAVDERTSCICFFGGDPSTQMDHALAAARLALQKTKGRILRICFETNGSMSKGPLISMAEIALESGGCVKFDLKAFNDTVHFALCGTSNKQTLENFKALSRYMDKRPCPPFLIASTLMVPGYVDEEEVDGISRFIAGLNQDIPYCLLAFSPHFMMYDLPTTSREHAHACERVARESGLKNVFIGNAHLLV